MKPKHLNSECPYNSDLTYGQIISHLQDPNCQLSSDEKTVLIEFLHAQDNMTGKMVTSIEEISDATGLAVSSTLFTIISLAEKGIIDGGFLYE